MVDVLDLTEERRQSGSSLKGLVLLGIVVLLLGGIGSRLVYLQLWEGQVYRERAEKNRIRPWYHPPGRGEIHDRNGHILASRKQVYALYLEPANNRKKDWPAILTKLSPYVHLSVEEMTTLLDQAGYRSPYPVRILQGLEPALITMINEYQDQLPGVQVVVETAREYPYGSTAAQVIGYTGAISEKELKRRQDENQDYHPGDIVGKIGAERIFEEELHGKWGGELREVNAAGQKIRDLGKMEAKAGKQLNLSLDIELQKIAEAGLGKRRGAVVAVDVKTGEVLVMASSPSFNPDMFSKPITPELWKSFQELDHPLLNRAVRPYPPASTFKIIMTAAALESGLMNPSSRLRTSAGLRIGGRVFHEHNLRGWGVIGFERALAVSADTFFYQVGLKVGPEKILDMARKFGFGERTALKLSSESPGLVPSEAWKLRLYGKAWSVGDTANFAIGQGFLLVTPLQNALMMAAVANGGYLLTPHLKKGLPVERQDLGLSPKTLEVIQRGLRGVVRPGGTAYRALGSFSNAGKSGTAEVTGHRTNAVYVGYAPYDNPQIAVSVMVEQGGHGGSDAAPIVASIYRHYLYKNQSAKLPIASKHHRRRHHSR